MTAGIGCGVKEEQRTIYLVVQFTQWQVPLAPYGYVATSAMHLDPFAMMQAWTIRISHVPLNRMHVIRALP